MKQAFRLVQGFAALALLALVVATFVSDWFAFDAFNGLQARIRGRIAWKLHERGVLVALTMDEDHPRDEVANLPVLCHGMESVEGRNGRARRFHLGRRGELQTLHSWAELEASGYSVLATIRAPEGFDGDQILFESGIGNGRIGLAIRDGQMVFSVPSAGEEPVELSYPFHAQGRFATVVAVVDGAASRACLYEDGKTMCEREVSPAKPPRGHIGFYSDIWKPFRGDIDEFDVWTRALSGKELAAVSHPGFSASDRNTPLLCLAADALQSMRRLAPEMQRSAERLYPRHLFASRGAMAALPDLDLSMGKADLRHFAMAHAESLRNGERTKKAADFRNCAFRTAHGAARVRICLDDVYSQQMEGCARRRAYEVVGDIDGDGVDECFRLYPPEDHARLHPGSALPLSMDETAYVRLSVNGDRQGAYCVESMARLGGAAAADMVLHKSPLHHAPVPEDDAYFRLSAEERERRTSRILSRILVEPRSEWSGREWRHRIRRARLEAPDRPLFSAFDALGGNEAPFLLAEDLDLSGEAFAGVASWTASDPEILDADGHVHRPDGDLPRRADLTPVFADGTPGAPLKFRVMPEKPRLPVLNLFVQSEVRRGVRCDFLADYTPAGGGTPVRLKGFGDTGGGIAHRGNTSYYHGDKRSFSLEFDTPHGILGPESACHLILISGYSDETRMRNRLCFDLFRGFSTPEAPRYAPEIDWTEVFVNGQYYGVFEMESRVNREMFGDAEAPPELFKVRKRSNLYAERSAHAFTQTYPPYPEVDCEKSLLHLMDLLADPSEEGFRENVAREVDVDCFIDFMLLVNFTGNEDGVVNNTFVARDGAGDRRYFFIPWDYDKTFLDGHPVRWMPNHLDLCLRKHSPDYAVRMRTRWNQLRRAILSDRALEDRLDAYRRQLDGYMAFEYELLGDREGETLDVPCRQLREEALRRAAALDAFCAERRGQP